MTFREFVDSGRELTTALLTNLGCRSDKQTTQIVARMETEAQGRFNADAAAQQALADLTPLQQLTQRRRASSDHPAPIFERLNGSMPGALWTDFDCLFLAATVSLTRLSAGSARHGLESWLNRRAQQDFKRLWLALTGLRVNPFDLDFPTQIPDFDAEFAGLLAGLRGSRGVILVQGGPGVGKTAFLRKACGNLLQHQIEQKPIVTTYVQNKRGSQKQFLIDLYAGFFNHYVLSTRGLRDSLMDSLPLVKEARERRMEDFERTVESAIVLPAHVLEDLLKQQKLDANGILNIITEFVAKNELALVILLDDIDGKVRSALSATQINTLLSLQDECSPCFIVGSVKPRGKVPRAISDRTVAEIAVDGLSKNGVHLLIDSFMSDPRASIVNQISGLDRRPLIEPKELQKRLLEDALPAVLSDSYIETRDSGPLYRPRSVVGICTRLIETVSADFQKIRITPVEEDIAAAVRGLAAVS
jgi:hypothetical protein